MIADNQDDLIEELVDALDEIAEASLGPIGSGKILAARRKAIELVGKVRGEKVSAVPIRLEYRERRRVEGNVRLPFPPFLALAMQLVTEAGLKLPPGKWMLSVRHAGTDALDPPFARLWLYGDEAQTIEPPVSPASEPFAQP